MKCGDAPLLNNVVCIYHSRTRRLQFNRPNRSLPVSNGVTGTSSLHRGDQFGALGLKFVFWSSRLQRKSRWGKPLASEVNLEDWCDLPCRMSVRNCVSTPPEIHRLKPGFFLIGLHVCYISGTRRLHLAEIKDGTFPLFHRNLRYHLIFVNYTRNLSRATSLYTNYIGCILKHPVKILSCTQTNFGRADRYVFYFSKFIRREGHTGTESL